MIITTARKPDHNLVEKARKVGETHGVPFVPRGNQNLKALIAAHEFVLLLSRERLTCHTRAGQFFLHPNMAAVRIKLIKQGLEDKMLQVMDLRPGESVLDCTAGLCADSLVAKFRVGEEGRVVALEKSLPVYIVVRHGIEHYSGPQRFRYLVAGIELKQRDFRDYLNAVKPKSFDIVYFDPMFDAPLLKASALMPLRPLACHNHPTKTDIQLAAKIARKKVVVKQRSFYDFDSLGLERAPGSQNRKIAYGVLNVEG